VLTLDGERESVEPWQIELEFALAFTLSSPLKSIYKPSTFLPSLRNQPFAKMGLFTSLISVAFATVALAAPTSRFTYFNLTTPAAGPCDLYTGPDGNIYATTFLANKLVKVTRTSPNPQLTEITIPYTRSPSPLNVLPAKLQGAGSCVVQPGYDGNVYIATGIRNQIAQYNPRTGKFKFFDASGGILGNLQPFNDGWPSKQGVREA
jgi:hypothetical protein